MQKRIDEFLMRFLGKHFPKLFWTGMAVFFVLLFGGLIYGTITNPAMRASEERMGWKLLILGGIAILFVIPVIIKLRNKRSRILRRGVTGVAEVLDLTVTPSDERYPNGAQTVALRVGFRDVGFAAEPQLYRMFTISCPEALSFEVGQHRPVQLLPGDLSLVLFERKATPGKPLQALLSKASAHV